MILTYYSLELPSFDNTDFFSILELDGIKLDKNYKDFYLDNDNKIAYVQDCDNSLKSIAKGQRFLSLSKALNQCVGFEDLTQIEVEPLQVFSQKIAFAIEKDSKIYLDENQDIYAQIYKIICDKAIQLNISISNKYKTLKEELKDKYPKIEVCYLLDFASHIKKIELLPFGKENNENITNSLTIHTRKQLNFSKLYIYNQELILKYKRVFFDNTSYYKYSFDITDLEYNDIIKIIDFIFDTHS